MTTGRQAILEFYKRENLPDNGGVDKWFDWGSAFGISLPIPNPNARVVLIAYHDLHHIVTGYGTDEAGEAEVGAWCLGSGGGPLLGQSYDLFAFLVGIGRYPSRTATAFYRGRQGRNLYRRPAASWLDQELARLRSAAGTDQPLDKRTPMDHMALAFTIGTALMQVALPLAMVGGVATYLLTVG